MAAIWLDTSFAYALIDRSDENHRPAVRALNTLGKAPFATSEHVLSEIYTLTRMRISWEAAQDSLALARQLTRRVLFGSAPIWKEAARFAAWKDQDFSMVDCLSFAFMTKLKISQYASFDGHFRTAGFKPCNGLR